MKKMIIACMAVLALVAGAGAQEAEARSQEALMLDYDTALTVMCPYGSIAGYVTPQYHKEPMGDGMVRIWGSPDGRYRSHDCPRDNAQAQRVYLARLERLCSPDIYQHSLSPEAEKMVCNFEALTGIRNGVDGRRYIAQQALDGWKLWFNKNKDKLRFCRKTRVIYMETLLPAKLDTP